MMKLVLPTVMLLAFAHVSGAAQSCVTEHADQDEQQEGQWDEELDQHVLLLQSKLALKKQMPWMMPGMMPPQGWTGQGWGAPAQVPQQPIPETTTTTTTTPRPSFLLEEINGFLATEITPNLTFGLSDLIRRKGDDPMASVLEADGLTVTDLKGLSNFKMTLTIHSVDIGLSLAAGTKIAVNISASAMIPQMRANVARTGLLGGEQTYQANIPDAFAYMALDGVASVVDNSFAISAITVPKCGVMIPSVNFEGGARSFGFVARELNEFMQKRKGQLGDKLAEKLRWSLQERLDDALPIPLHLTLRTNE